MLEIWNEIKRREKGYVNIAKRWCKCRKEAKIALYERGFGGESMVGGAWTLI